MTNQRSGTLANRIVSGAEALADFAERLSESEWRAMVPNEGRLVGVLVHHVASAYPIEIDLAQAMSSGNPISGITSDAVDQMNAQHAQGNTDVPQSATIALLRQNARQAADRVREFSDKQLDTAVSVSLNADAVLTTQFFIEDHAVRHSLHHLANIRAALRR